MSVLELRDVSKTYGEGAAEVHALRDVDLTVDAGELVAVMGPSGSGKSTLLTIAGSLEQPTSGEVFVGGVPVSGDVAQRPGPPAAPVVGYVFQDFNLLAGLTAAENVSLPLELDGMPARAARAAGLTGAGGARTGRAGRELPGRAVRRRAPAGRDRPRGRRRPQAAARRRTVRCAGLGQRRGGDAADPGGLSARRGRRAS